MSFSRTVARLGVTLALGIVSGLPIVGSASSQAYAQMAPLSRYLMDRGAEIDLARSAAPAAVSVHANVLVLTRHGYETAVHGTNGFTCLVERSWTSPFDSSDFWNWKLRGPICYNAAASDTVLRYTLFRTQMALSGVGDSQMLARFKGAIQRRQLPLAKAGSMAYMMSRRQYLGDAPKAWYPHLMLYAPSESGANPGEGWGANLPGSPVAFDSSHHVVPEPWTLFFVLVPQWSDGTAAPKP
jgi:hypothetical protein